MRYTAAFKLNGSLAAAVAVEWTNVADPVDSGSGWEACIRQPNGDWRFSTHEIVADQQVHWRGPGLFANIALRYRLTATAPWSPISASRKEIILVDVNEEAAVPRQP